MAPPRRAQADRSAATRAALVTTARRLFAEHGYAAIGTERIAREADVTRGAMYHHFGDKATLFSAVVEAVEIDLMGSLQARMAGVSSTDPVDVLTAGADAWIAASTEPEVQRILLVDGPSVLGWEEWRAVGLRHGLGLVADLLRLAMDTGRIPRQPVEPLAHVLIGALDEAALYVARADDPARATAEVGDVLRRVIASVVAG